MLNIVRILNIVIPGLTLWERNHGGTGGAGCTLASGRIDGESDRHLLDDGNTPRLTQAHKVSGISSENHDCIGRMD
jgi:hypothetical protein